MKPSLVHVVQEDGLPAAGMRGRCVGLGGGARGAVLSLAGQRAAAYGPHGVTFSTLFCQPTLHSALAHMHLLRDRSARWKL